MAQSPLLSSDRLRFAFSRLKERLWVKPLLRGVLSVGGTFLAKLAETGHMAMIVAAKNHSRMALNRSKHAMTLSDDIDAVVRAAAFSAA